jgi:phytoene dehydrogenase-like protein
MAAAIRLAQFGKRVALVERQDRLGGLNTYYYKDGRLLETGLHALTNYPGNAGQRGPLGRIFRSLQIPESLIPLAPQRFSEILCPSRRIAFSNDVAELTQSIGKAFPGVAGPLTKFLSDRLLPYEAVGATGIAAASSRQILAEYLPESVVEALLLPVMAFGSPTEEDLTFGQFSMLFRSIFLEGLCRPVGGIRLLLDVLRSRLEQEGVTIRLGCEVTRIRLAENHVHEIVLDTGEKLSAHVFITTLGWPETVRLAGHSSAGAWGRAEMSAVGGKSPAIGKISFLEVVAELDRPPEQFDFRQSLVFYSCEGAKFRCPEGLWDARLGVICAPANFEYPASMPAQARPGSDSARNSGEEAAARCFSPSGVDPAVVRITCLANYSAWAGLKATEYQHRKHQAAADLLNMVSRLGWDFRPAVKNCEVTTPLTIARYCGRVNGAVYGSPEKLWSGRTPWKNLWIAGTDQGLVGVVGTLLSGIFVANQCLRSE